MKQSVERFSSRIENYIKYRPDYPAEIVEFLRQKCDLTATSVIADIGSGTGKLTKIFLDEGYEVMGVEPNEGMRAAAEQLLAHYAKFDSINGSAEATTLQDNSVSLITAGQAFHWFNIPLTKREALRILQPGGWVALIWNERKLKSSPFLADYEALLLQYGTDYSEVRHDKIDGSIMEFFAPQGAALKVFPNEQQFDLESLKGRLFSSSYTPEPQHPKFETMVRELEDIFWRNQEDGRVVFEYDTTVYYGQLTT